MFQMVAKWRSFKEWETSAHLRIASSGLGEPKVPGAGLGNKDLGAPALALRERFFWGAVMYQLRKNWGGPWRNTTKKR